MAFSILRYGSRITAGLVERSNCFSILASSKVQQTKLFTNKHLDCHIKVLQCLVASPRFQTAREYSKMTGQKVEHKKEYNLTSASESDSDKDKAKKHHRGESDFWRRKMRTIHNLLDVNKDGVLSFDDFKVLTDKFVSLGHLTEQQTNEFRICMQELWEAQWGEITPYNLIKVEQYLEDMHHVLNDKQLKKKAHNILPYLFEAVDKDNSGEISVEEFKLFFECLGIDEEHAIIAFSFIDANKDGKLSIKEFVKLGRDYFLSENESAVSKYFWGPLVTN